MPAISDPGYAVVAAAVAAGLNVEVIPGVSALTAAVAGAGLPTDVVTFVGFPPPRAGERARWLARWRETPGVLVLFEAPHRLRATLEALAQALGNRPVVVAHELTKVHESWHRGPLDKLIADEDLPAKGEFTILVGPAPEAADGQDAAATLAPEQVGVEFGQMTKNGAMTRRDAIAELARRHGLRKRQVYAMVEAAKHSGRMTKSAASVVHVVVLAAGKGTRMKSATPKVLHPVAGRRMLDHVLAAAEALTPASVTVVVGHEGDRVRDAYAGGRARFVVQEPQLGTGHALLQAEPLLRDATGTVVLLSGDVPLLSARRR